MQDKKTYNKVLPILLKGVKMLFRKPKRKVNRVFIHCSASDVPSHDNVEVIRQWHLARGFDDIAYHFFVHKNGTISRGRDLEKTPASQHGQNVGTLAICLHGYRVEKFTKAQVKALQDISLYIHKIYYERVSFHGHKEVAHKACPIIDYRRILKLDRYGSLGLTASQYQTPTPIKDNQFIKLKYGDKGEAVKRLQRLLGIKVTGVYRRQTLAKVKDFKSQHGLYRSGIVTEAVWKLLTKPILSHTPSNNNHHPNKLPELKQGSRGSAVELLQRCLFIKVDGIFGPQVAKAVKRFKIRHGLYKSDFVNAYIWKLLLKQKSIRG